MATLRWALLVALAGCGDLQGFGGPMPPLASFHVEVTGDIDAVRVDNSPVHLRVALVWGRQWLVEPLCILSPENDQAKAVIDAGCRDPFGFVPARVETSVPVDVGVPATIDLFAVPTAAVMVGDVTARVAYGSFIVFDDHDDNGLLQLASPRRPGRMNPMDPSQTLQNDRVYGASFVAMTEPDQRVAFREGAFNEAAAFYPRAGCGDPPPGFSVDAASGFDKDMALLIAAAGMLPPEKDPTMCAETAPSAAPLITIPLQKDEGEVRELACTERSTDSSVRYVDPVPFDPQDNPPPDLKMRTYACVHTPSFGAPSDTIELVVAGLPTDPCVGLTHYILKGCAQGPACAVPDWDHTQNPPSWWPCR